MQTAPGGRPSAASHYRRLRSFASLKWYEEVIKFLFTLAAKTSEVLLAAGLVVSTANFLTEGKVMGNSAGLATAWSWAQSLAIDSSLGVTFNYVFISIKHRDWIKVFCYGLLTALLAVVAGTITNIDTFSHALHTTIANAITQVGLDVKLLTTLRAIAVVGFVLMSRLKDVSFKELYEPDAPRASRALQKLDAPEVQENDKTASLIKELIDEALAPFMTKLAQQEERIIEELETLFPSIAPTTTGTLEQDSRSTSARTDVEGKVSRGQHISLEHHDDSSEERDARLARAYQELQAEGERISGRGLAARAHVRRSTCNRWLATHHPEVTNEEPEEEPEHGQL